MHNFLVTDEQRRQLLANGRESSQNRDVGPVPVLKLFTPDGCVRGDHGGHGDRSAQEGRHCQRG
jgi:hypothetical protein